MLEAKFVNFQFLANLEGGFVAKSDNFSNYGSLNAEE